MSETILVLFTTVVVLLSVFVINQGILVTLYFRKRSSILSAPIPEESASLKELASPAGSPNHEKIPKVTVQVPVYNERYMVERVIEATSNLDYPADLLEIQILDDSTDDTLSIAEKAAATAREKGVNIEIIHRPHRTGYKAGALDEGLKKAHGELIAIFDADFVPHPNFLKRVVLDYKTFDNPEVGFVQTRWVFLNRNKNFVTRGEAMLLETHFLLDNLTRHNNNLPINFNGSGGIWRRQCIEDAGGWEFDTLTEDLDLSYRAQMKGWKAVYLPREESPNELPDDAMAFKQQWRRWSRGPAQCFRKLWWRVLSSKLSLGSKVSAIMYVSACFMHPLILLLILLWPQMVLHIGFMNLPPELRLVLPLLMIFVGSSYVVHHDQGKPFTEFLVDVPCSLILALGSSFSNSVAVFMGLFVRTSGVFERTPKLALSAETAAGGSATAKDGPIDAIKPETGIKLRKEKYILNSDWTLWFDWIITLYLFTMGILIALAGRWGGLLTVSIYFSVFLFFSMSQTNHLRRSLELAASKPPLSPSISTPPQPAASPREDVEEPAISRPFQS